MRRQPIPGADEVLSVHRPCGSLRGDVYRNRQTCPCEPQIQNS